MDRPRGARVALEPPGVLRGVLVYVTLIGSSWGLVAGGAWLVAGVLPDLI